MKDFIYNILFIISEVAFYCFKLVKQLFLLNTHTKEKEKEEEVKIDRTLSSPEVKVSNT